MEHISSVERERAQLDALLKRVGEIQSEERKREIQRLNEKNPEFGLNPMHVDVYV